MRTFWLLGLCSLLLSAGVALSAGEDPSFYVRKDTWQQTMIASREALMTAEQARLEKATLVSPRNKTTDPVNKDALAFQPFASGEMTTGGRNTRQVKVRVSGLQVLWLIHTAPHGGDGKLTGCWGEAALVAKDGKKTRLDELKPVVSRGAVESVADAGADNGKKRRQRKATLVSPRNKTTRIGKEELAHGLLVQPNGELCYRLDGQFETFEAKIAVTAAGQKGTTMEFRVSALPMAEALAREGDRAALWALIERDFASPQAVVVLFRGETRREIARERERRLWERDWKPGDFRQIAQRYAGLIGSDPAARSLAGKASTPADVQALAARYHKAEETKEQLAQAGRVNLKALRLAVEDLTRTFGEKYPKGREYLERLAAIEKTDQAALAKADPEKARQFAVDLVSLQGEALLDNPLLNFDKLLLIKRGNKSPRMGLPQNWQGNCSLPRRGFDDEIDILSPVRPGGRLTTLYRPKRDVMVADVDLSFDGDRLLFSSVADSGLWQVFEMKTDGSGPRQVTAGPVAEVDNYDACYLPNGRILFDSAAVMAGVPCVGGADHVANLFLAHADGSGVRQLGFDQDHNWCPTVLNDGRVMYSRWEYGDTPHYFTRLLFHMNPDGTQQMELSGSNSYWPNSTFYARPIPGHPSKVVAVISGHHGVARMGELVIFDTARGRTEASGAVQRIPGYGRPVQAIIADGLVNGSWPKFLHPWPLSERYFLVSCMLQNGSSWGIYLVDVFDNILPICELPGYGLFEPIPLRATPRPPVIPDRVDPQRRDALVYLSDVYTGGGLRGVPRGAVRALRLFEWHYAYQHMGGHQNIGVEGGWDVKRILGTVPVEADGSAFFHVPANTPIAVQPLDEEGRALQLMRSWFVAMPGEVLSCVGCHESQGTGTPNQHAMANQRPPSPIQPWHGPARGFSFPREVQPVLDRNCVSCHNGQPRPDGKSIPNFAANEDPLKGGLQTKDPVKGGAQAKKGPGGFDSSYLALHPYVRRPGPESDYHMLPTAEYRANTSELIQMLAKGHHGVQLDREAWDRLYTWIDLNVPDHGTWTEHAGEARTAEQRKLRAKYRKLFANIDEDPEAIPQTPPYTPPALASAPVPDSRQPTADNPPALPGWPFDTAEARRRQAAAGPRVTRTVDLGGGGTLELVLIPAGEFLMGDPAGETDERPLTRVRIPRPFWMGRTEITNAQFRYFNPRHDSRFIDQHWKDHTTPGYPANGPGQPAIRLSWLEAVAFCRWLTERTGDPFALPTEAQWEWACRAGTATPFFYGDLNADFSRFANLGDLSLQRMAVTGINPQPIPNPTPFQAFLPMERRFNDGQMIVANVGLYQPNPWGLLDLHGNVAEWTLSAYRPYPYVDGDGRNQATPSGEKVVRGGSWYDRPMRCRSAFRLAYPSWQGVYNVGFRVVCPAAGPVAQLR